MPALACQLDPALLLLFFPLHELKKAAFGGGDLPCDWVVVEEDLGPALRAATVEVDVQISTQAVI